jgi:transposase
MGEVSRFPSIREAISYCGLCGDEKSSADKVMRTPLSKQRNKHIQRVLVEAMSSANFAISEPGLIHLTMKVRTATCVAGARAATVAALASGAGGMRIGSGACS